MLTVTCTPARATGLPEPSLSRIIGCCPNTAPLCTDDDGWVTIRRPLGEPAVIEITEEVAPVRPLADKLRVRAPAAPVIEGPAQGATPLASGATVVRPFRFPPPEAMVAMTLIPC